MHITNQKTQLRQAIKDRIAHMTDTALKAEGRSITRRILEALPPPPLTICAYVPLRDEAFIWPLLYELLERKYTLFLPCFENMRLTFRQATDLKALIPGGLDIPEPAKDAPELDVMECDIVLVPGRAFDAKNNRLGRSGGGYDRWIQKQRERNPQTQYWGIAMDCQMVPEVPVEEHDEKMDRVITGR